MYLSHVASSHGHGPGSSLAQSSPPHMGKGIGEWVMGTTEDGRGVVSICEDTEGSGRAQQSREDSEIHQGKAKDKEREQQRGDREREGGGMKGEGWREGNYPSKGAGESSQGLWSEAQGSGWGQVYPGRQTHSLDTMA